MRLTGLTDGIGERLSRYRKLAGMSAQQLSDRISGTMSRGVIANIESGRKTELTLEQIAALAWALEVPFFALALPLDRPNYWVPIVAGDDSGDDLRVIDAWAWMARRPEGHELEMERGLSEPNAARGLAGAIERRLIALGSVNMGVHIVEKKLETEPSEQWRDLLAERVASRQQIVAELLDLGVTFDDGEEHTDARDSPPGPENISIGYARIVRRWIRRED